jgi:hypothetical protein
MDLKYSSAAQVRSEFGLSIFGKEDARKSGNNMFIKEPMSRHMLHLALTVRIQPYCELLPHCEQRAPIRLKD